MIPAPKLTMEKLRKGIAKGLTQITVEADGQ